MDYLSRESAPFDGELWKNIDTSVVEAACKQLVARRFLQIYGPLGAGVQGIHIDDETKEEEFKDGIVRTLGRRYVELPQIYADFTLFWRDLEASSNRTPDLSSAMQAAQDIARREDKLIFFGDAALGVTGLFNTKGVQSIKRADWGEGENSYIDVAQGLQKLDEAGFLGRYALVVSPDLYLKLQRIQPGTGLMEIDRIRAMVDGRLYRSYALGSGRAALVCAEAQNMDLAIGQDMAVAYLELVDLNHHLRVLETAMLRLKRKKAVVVFE